MLARRRAVRLRPQRVSNLKVGCAGGGGSRRPLVKQPLGGPLRKEVMIKLTPIQSQVLYRFPKDKWKSAYDLQVSMATLNALVEKGFLERRGVGTLGAHYSPRTTVEYRVCPTKHAPDVVESDALSGIFHTSEVSASEADSTPATPQVM